MAGLGVILFFVGLLRKESRSATIQIIIIGAVISGIFILITPDPSRQKDLGQGPVTSPSEYRVGGDIDTSVIETSQPQAEEPPSIWSWSLLLIIPTVVGLVFIVRPRWLRWRREQRQIGELRTAVASATGEMATLEEPENFANVVVRCYLQMLTTIEETRSVHRERGMTAREFEARLIQIGADPADVTGLTRLFEKYRYGASAPTSGDQGAAEGYLSRIAAALGADVA